MTNDPRHPHSHVPDGELVAAVRANDPGLFKLWLSEGMQDLGEPTVEELLMDWLDPFLTVEEQYRLMG